MWEIFFVFFFSLLCLLQSQVATARILDHETWIVNPIVSGSYIAEVISADLEMIDDQDFERVLQLLLQYKVLAFRNQSSLSVEGQRAFSKRFGELHVHLESASHFEGHKDVNLVSNIKNENGGYIGLYGKHVELFHTDLSWATIPCQVTLLKSVLRPSNCGDTQFINTVGAYQALETELKDYLRSLTAEYSYLKHRNLTADGGADNLSMEEVQAANSPVIHPVITKHPLTDEYNIYANPTHTQAIVGMSAEESSATLEWLFHYTSQPQFMYTHTWEDHDLLIWDNRAVQHRATGCPEDQPRMLVRTTVNNAAAPVGDDIALEERKTCSDPDDIKRRKNPLLDRSNAVQ